jgi:hypothetical protein
MAFYQKRYALGKIQFIVAQHDKLFHLNDCGWSEKFYRSTMSVSLRFWTHRIGVVVGGRDATAAALTVNKVQKFVCLCPGKLGTDVRSIWQSKIKSVMPVRLWRQ